MCWESNVAKACGTSSIDERCEIRFESVTAFRVTKASTAASTGGRTRRSVSAIGGAGGDAEAIPTARSYLAGHASGTSRTGAQASSTRTMEGLWLPSS